MTYKDKDKTTILMNMAKHHDWPDAIKAFVEKASRCEEDGGKLVTCEENDKRVRKISVDLDAMNNFGETALHLAILNDHGETAGALVESGVPDNRPVLDLFRAAGQKWYKPSDTTRVAQLLPSNREQEFLKLVRFLLQADPDPEGAEGEVLKVKCRESSGNTVLMEMARKYDWRTAATELLAKPSVLIDTTIELTDGKTAADYPCGVSVQNTEGENVAVKDKDEKTAADYARENKNEAFAFLLDVAEDRLFKAAGRKDWYTSTDTLKWKSLTESQAEEEFLKLVDGEGERGGVDDDAPELKYVDAKRNTVLMEMMKHHDWPNAAARLIEKGPSLETADSSESVRYVDAQNNDEETALHIAFKIGRAKTGMEVMKKGAKDRLFEAAGGYKEEKDFLKVLDADDMEDTVPKGEDVTYTSKDGMTVLMELAKEHDWLAAVTGLLKKVEVRRDNPCSDARKEDDGCKLLNAQVNAEETRGGMTALHFAFDYVFREKEDHETQPAPLSTTVFLIELGADRTLKTKPAGTGDTADTGKTAEESARGMANLRSVRDKNPDWYEIEQLVAYFDGAKPSGRKWDEWKAAMTEGQTFADAMKDKPNEPKSPQRDAFERKEQASLLKSLGLTEGIERLLLRVKNIGVAEKTSLLMSLGLTGELGKILGLTTRLGEPQWRALVEDLGKLEPGRQKALDVLKKHFDETFLGVHAEEILEKLGLPVEEAATQKS